MIRSTEKMELCQAIIILSAFCLMFIMKGVSFANDNPFGKALISYEARSRGYYVRYFGTHATKRSPTSVTIDVVSAIMQVNSRCLDVMD